MSQIVSCIKEKYKENPYLVEIQIQGVPPEISNSLKLLITRTAVILSVNSQSCPSNTAYQELYCTADTV